MTLLQAAAIGLLQGFTELFPISSLGHSVLLPQLLHWKLDQSSDQFVAFLVATHLSTALVLFLFFFKDWMRIIGGLVRSLIERQIRSEDTYAKLGWLLVVGTIPAGICGLLFEQTFKQLFGAAHLVALALMLNGAVLYAAELLRRRAPEGAADDTKVTKLSWAQAVFIGIAQCFALIPGFSRTGLTMTGGLMSGLSHENAARFSFLLATPIIGAAALLKIPSLFAAGSDMLFPTLVGSIAAAFAAWASVAFLVKYFEHRTLRPFAIYCALAGALSLLLLA